jgi:SNF2 family DNA or RNA helicase
VFPFVAGARQRCSSGKVHAHRTADKQRVPRWNPAAEEQAIDRIYRIGQTRPVHVTRLVMHNSIEESMLKLADVKRQIYEGALGNKKTAKELQSMRWETMTSIFKI